MDFATFDATARRMWRRIPDRFKQGVTAFIVVESAEPDPVFPDVFILGHCIPDEAAAASGVHQSLIHIYHGSFVEEAAKEEDFPWYDELWITITHELQHHLEHRGGEDPLGDEDDVQLANLARRNNEPFTEDFYKWGTQLDAGVWQADGDLFIERALDKLPWSNLAESRYETAWQDLILRIPKIPATELTGDGPLFVVAQVEVAFDPARPALDEDPDDDDLRDDGDPLIPWDEVVLVLRKRRRWFGLW
jgi:hypothetical protein